MRVLVAGRVTAAPAPAVAIYVPPFWSSQVCFTRSPAESRASSGEEPPVSTDPIAICIWLDSSG